MMQLRRFKKGMRKIGNRKSIGTLKAQKLLRRLKKEEKSGTKEIKNSQENVECTGQRSWNFDNNGWEEKEEDNNS